MAVFVAPLFVALITTDIIPILTVPAHFEMDLMLKSMAGGTITDMILEMVWIPEISTKGADMSMGPETALIPEAKEMSADAVGACCLLRRPPVQALLFPRLIMTLLRLPHREHFEWIVK